MYPKTKKNLAEAARILKPSTSLSIER